MKTRKHNYPNGGIYIGKLQPYKRVPYLQSYESLTDKGYKEIVINEVNQQDTLYDARIQPKDLLSITVNTSDPQAAAPFNLTMQTSINVAQANSTYVTSQPTLQQYLVNNEGEIDFPVIGKLKIGGLTKTAAEKLIREQLRPYLKETPIRHRTHVQLQNISYRRSEPSRYIYHQQRESKSL